MRSRASMRSEEHTSELQSRNDISYAVFCLKKKKTKNPTISTPLMTMETAVPSVGSDAAAPAPSPSVVIFFFFFFFNDTATTEIYTSLHTLSLHDALPILPPSTVGSYRPAFSR